MSTSQHTSAHTHTCVHAHAHKKRRGPSRPGDQLSGPGTGHLRSQPETWASAVNKGERAAQQVSLQEKEIWRPPCWLSGKEPTHQCRRHRFDPRSRKIAYDMEHLSPYATAPEPTHPRVCAPRQEKPTHHSRRGALASCN